MTSWFSFGGGGGKKDGEDKAWKAKLNDADVGGDFYYNKELKMWVTRGKEEEAKAKRDADAKPPDLDKIVAQAAAAPKAPQSSEDKMMAAFTRPPTSYTIGGGRKSGGGGMSLPVPGANLPIPGMGPIPGAPPAPPGAGAGGAPGGGTPNLRLMEDDGNEDEDLFFGSRKKASATSAENSGAAIGAEAPSGLEAAPAETAHPFGGGDEGADRPAGDPFGGADLDVSGESSRPAGDEKPAFGFGAGPPSFGGMGFALEERPAPAGAQVAPPSQPTLPEIQEERETAGDPFGLMGSPPMSQSQELSAVVPPVVLSQAGGPPAAETAYSADFVPGFGPDSLEPIIDEESEARAPSVSDIPYPASGFPAGEPPRLGQESSSPREQHVPSSFGTSYSENRPAPFVASTQQQPPPEQKFEQREQEQRPTFPPSGSERFQLPPTSTGEHAPAFPPKEHSNGKTVSFDVQEPSDARKDPSPVSFDVQEQSAKPISPADTVSASALDSQPRERKDAHDEETPVPVSFSSVPPPHKETESDLDDFFRKVDEQLNAVPRPVVPSPATVEARRQEAELALQADLLKAGVAPGGGMSSGFDSTPAESSQSEWEEDRAGGGGAGARGRGFKVGKHNVSDDELETAVEQIMRKSGGVESISLDTGRSRSSGSALSAASLALLTTEKFAEDRDIAPPRALRATSAHLSSDGEQQHLLNAAGDSKEQPSSHLLDDEDSPSKTAALRRSGLELLSRFDAVVVSKPISLVEDPLLADENLDDEVETGSGCWGDDAFHEEEDNDGLGASWGGGGADGSDRGGEELDLERIEDLENEAEDAELEAALDEKPEVREFLKKCETGNPEELQLALCQVGCYGRSPVGRRLLGGGPMSGCFGELWMNADFDFSPAFFVNYGIFCGGGIGETGSVCGPLRFGWRVVCTAVRGDAKIMLSEIMLSVLIMLSEIMLSVTVRLKMMIFSFPHRWIWTNE